MIRTHHRPPQGTVNSFNPDVEDRMFEAASRRMQAQIDAAGLDPDIAKLQEALSERPKNLPEIQRLTPILKSRYGSLTYYLVTGRRPTKKMLLRILSKEFEEKP